MTIWGHPEKLDSTVRNLDTENGKRKLKTEPEPRFPLLALETSITIQKRFCGPPESGNGGYSAGIIGTRIAGPAEVTLRKPPPLDRPLTLESSETEARLLDGDTLIGEGRAAPLDLEVPPPPTADQAAAAGTHYRGFELHLFPRCFVCGPDRAPGDGLRIFAGDAGPHTVAAPWVPDASLGDERGSVRPEFLWAALDCPGYFAAMTGVDLVPALLGRMHAEVLQDVKVGEPLIVVGWSLSHEGRKRVVGTAVFRANGELCARAKSTWIDIG